MNKLTQLCIDARRNRVGNFSAENEKFIDEAARRGFAEILESETLNWQAWRKHKVEVFEIIEDVLKVTLPDAWDQSYFYNELVEVKNLLLGQKNEFIVEDNSTLIVSKFSGNHWNIDRQKLPAGKVFSVSTEWIGVRVYDELERFLKGVVTLVQMFDKIQDAIQKEIDARVYSAFNGAGTYLPAAFKETGSFDKDTFLGLCTKVQIACQRNIRIAGTRVALSKLSNSTPVAWVSENMKEEKNTTGRIRIWEGINTVEIPQTFIRGTYTVKSSDNILYVLPENYKPVKLFYEGDVRTLELNEKQTIDQTIDVQTQTKLGVGLVFDSLFGTANI